MPKNNVTDLITDQEKERLRRQEQRRQQVLDRLWEIANLSAEMTRGSITGQVKAIQMIVAIEGLIPGSRAGSAKKNSVSHPSPDPVVPEPNPACIPEADPPPQPVPSEPLVAGGSSSHPDAIVPFPIEKNGSAHGR
ncbi:MAG: hypothetical protein WCD57_06100 [Acidobacteriaceae bacterium]